ncbi:DUF547 domain-containing protein [Xanthovirga aplysinae]|uniref:DUF547 domain-containing protein n=1 Tax=Xanthovirga aplysinae TaxID=2529853 RepID=UPI0012BBCCED|nr:DUF547 domain-containing protein [Xanthovirga aplysinae]MTI32990.1 DUF547 domain-containing protein [Xanthovirga aplysinae]
MDNNFVEISKNLLLAVKEKSDFFSFMATLEQVSLWELTENLNSDEKKKAFWLNVYNAYVQIILQADKSLYNNRDLFYTRKRVIIASVRLSLDDIEHGILRRSKAKISFGYLNKPNVSHAERQLRVSRVDPRIHFALNCGALASPYIHIFDEESFNKQINDATRQYLETKVSFKDGENSLCIPKFFKWFLADFRGSKGVKSFLKKYGYQDAVKQENLQITFMPFEWDLSLNRFK